jgi:hypothetical protein
MFPHCANPDCTASFGNFREGLFFRFRRAQLPTETTTPLSISGFARTARKSTRWNTEIIVRY